MSPPAGKPFVAIIDSKDLRRASITSLLEPWANSESLRLMSFASEPREALQGETDCRMLVYSIGSESVAAISIQAQGFIHSGISSALAYHALSFILKGGTYFPRSAFSLPDTPDNSRNAPRNRSESESKSNGHGTNGNGSAHSRSHSGYQPVNLTARQGQILEHVRLGESNKLIGRRLGMTEGTVKVHLREMMRKLNVSNRTQLALGRTANTESDLRRAML